MLSCGRVLAHYGHLLEGKNYSALVVVVDKGLTEDGAKVEIETTAVV